MTLPVPNLKSPIADVRKESKGWMAYLIPPWNSFFQQLVQPAPEVANVTLTNSPFVFTPNSNGNLIISGGTVSNISLIRGTVTILIATSTATPRIVPVSVGDTVSVTYSVTPTVQFLGA